MKFKNLKMVGYVVFGRGSFNQLDETLARTEKREGP
jgi:3-deoxy-alpha-D-manno-octulosonate 8-oxidase